MQRWRMHVVLLFPAESPRDGTRASGRDTHLAAPLCVKCRAIVAEGWTKFAVLFLLYHRDGSLGCRQTDSTFCGSCLIAAAAQLG